MESNSNLYDRLFCSGQSFGPWFNGMFSECFTSIVLFGLVTLGIFVFGGVRLLRIYQLPVLTAPYTKRQVLEFGLCLVGWFVAFSTLISRFIMDNYYGYQVLEDFYELFSWGFCLVIIFCEAQRGLLHTWTVRAFWISQYVIQSLLLQAISDRVFKDRMLNDFEIYTTVSSFLVAGVLSISGLWFNKLPRTSSTVAVQGSINNDTSGEAIVTSTDSTDEDDVEDGLLKQEEGYSKVDVDAPDTPKTPFTSANFFKRIIFSWMSPILATGYKRPLTDKDLWDLPQADQACFVAERFELMWKNQLDNPKGPSFVRALWDTFGKEFASFGVFKLGNDIAQFCTPMLLNQIISFLEDSSAPLWNGLLITLGMFFVQIIQTMFVNQYFFRVFRMGQQIRSSLVSVVYRKSVRLSSAARQKSTVGEIVNHQSIDAQRFQNSTTFLHMLWSAPLQIIISFVLLWKLVGPSVLAGFGYMILVIPVNLFLARKQGAIQKQMLGAKDARIKETSEILNGVRVMKFFAWEDSFLGKIGATREKELATLKRSMYLRAFTTFFFSVSPTIVAVLTFTAFVLTGGNLTASIAFPALALFNILRFPLGMLPNVISGLVEAKVSVTRLENFLLGEEIDSTAIERGDPSLNVSSSKPVSIKVTDGEFEWNSTNLRPALSNINFTINQGELVAVVGSVGSGKSSLVSALLGEIQKKSGHVQINGTVAYVPQQAWMENASLRENILFGKPFTQYYYDCLDVCELKQDIAVLPNADLTEIGEKGINLSGGQKQRVSCARAMYQKADIYIMDSPLSAVDAHVGKAIFQNLIVGALRGATRILVTHQLHLLPYMDKIIVLSEGKIAEIGSYEQLMKNGGELSELVKTYVTESNEEEDLKSSSQPTTPSSKKDKDKEKGKEQDKDKGKLITTETKQEGSVSWTVYKRYFQSAGGFIVIFGILVMYCFEYGANIFANWWLGNWSSDVEGTNSVRNLRIYVAIGLTGGMITFFRGLSISLASIKSSRLLHSRMLKKVIHAPMEFFDTTPIGRVLNRFSKDQNAIDETLPFSMGMLMNQCFQVLSILIVISSVTPFFLVPALPLAYLYYWIQQYYLSSSRELQRLDSISKSPIFAQFSETLNGISTIRAFNVTDNFIRENDKKVDLNVSAYFMNTNANRWLSIRLEFLCTCVVTAAALFSVLERNNIEAGLAGLSLTYALNLTGVLNWLVRQSSEVETQLVAVERVIEYTDLESEGPYEVPENKPTSDWPQTGAIEFRDLKMRYRKGLDLVLKGISAYIAPQEKIGIVGRTGAGKSSLILALFRMVEADEGSVFIDGVNIARIGLKDLRSRLSIIPQDPTLYTGTIRSNLDPLGLYSDNELWRALDHVYLKNAIEQLEGGLNATVSENGESLSVGQRQLMCLGRALLRNSRILVMDEATASIDLENDSLIQKTIREQFKDVTVLTIAHRINTIIDNNKVMVLDKGLIVEYDTPENLLKEKSSVFYSLAHQSGLV